jgi:hypothetical protein
MQSFWEKEAVLFTIPTIREVIPSGLVKRRTLSMTAICVTRQAMTFTGTGLTWQAPLSSSLWNVSYPSSNPIAFAWVRRIKERILASSSLRFKGEAK